MRWNYYKLQQLSLLQSARDIYYKLRQRFYYKVRHGFMNKLRQVIQIAMNLLQIATGITKCDDYYKLQGSLSQKKIFSRSKNKGVVPRALPLDPPLKWEERPLIGLIQIEAGVHN